MEQNKQTNKPLNALNAIGNETNATATTTQYSRNRQRAQQNNNRRKMRKW